MLNKREYYNHTRKNRQRTTKKRRKVWYRSEFNNPYFTYSQPINLKSYLYFVLGSSVIGLIIYFLLFSRYLLINSVTVNSPLKEYNKQISAIINNQLNNKIFSFLDQANYFLFNSTGLKGEIADKFLVKNIVVKKILPNKVEVSFDQIMPVFTWIQGDHFYQIDEKGTIIKELFSAQPVTDNLHENKTKSVAGFNLEEVKKFLTYANTDINLPIVYNDKNITLKSRDQISNQAVFGLVNKINVKIVELNINVVVYTIDDINQPQKIEVVTDSGWKIYLNSDNLDKQLDNLETLMNSNFKTTAPTEYIELRYGNKLYYK